MYNLYEPICPLIVSYKRGCITLKKKHLHHLKMQGFLDERYRKRQIYRMLNKNNDICCKNMFYSISYKSGTYIVQCNFNK